MAMVANQPQKVEDSLLSFFRFVWAFPLKQFLRPQHIKVFQTLHLGTRGARESICCNW